VAGIDGAVDQLVALYERVIAEHREQDPATAGEEGRAAAAYLRWLDARFQEGAGQAMEVAALRRDLAALQGTATWRLRERLVRWPPLVKLYRSLRRRP
jgi:hypothetical protein